MTTPDDPNAAAGKFAMISIVRLMGVFMVIGGMLILADVFDLPRLIGWVLLPMGLFEFFVMPLFLARKWRTPPE